MNELRNRRDKHLLDSEGRPLTSEQDVRHYLSMLEANANDEFPPFPEFWESSKWVNVSRSLDGKDFSGRLLVLDFWTFCCINCMHILPVWIDRLQKVAKYKMWRVGKTEIRSTGQTAWSICSNKASSDASMEYNLRHRSDF